MSSGFPLFVSYYTGNSYYDECSEKLIKYCEALGISIEIENVQDLGAYWKNTLQKPSYILRKIKEHQRDLIWIDIDTKIYQYNDCFKKWESDIIMASFTGTLQGIKASPIGIKYNERSINFLAEWEVICTSRIGNDDIDLDHDILKYEILPHLKNKLTIEIMNDNLDPKNFTEGSIIENGTSIVPNKWKEMNKVISKNKFRIDNFLELAIEDFKNII
jgi:hypothetical protein